MSRRRLLTDEERVALFGVPTTRNALAKLYTLEAADLEFVLSRRTPANRLGFAATLALLRHPGPAPSAVWPPPELLAAYLAEPRRCAPSASIRLRPIASTRPSAAARARGTHHAGLRHRALHAAPTASDPRSPRFAPSNDRGAVARAFRFSNSKRFRQRESLLLQEKCRPTVSDRGAEKEAPHLGCPTCPVSTVVGGARVSQMVQALVVLVDVVSREIARICGRVQVRMGMSMRVGMRMQLRRPQAAVP